ncbi:hypothetical protein N9B14_01350 [Akkermansiaceae bacterium]|nr:hypothetical protein [Akkermansiaceae bacterium]
MLLVFHRLKFETNIADQTSYKDDWQLCETIEEARRQIEVLQKIHGVALDSWGIGNIMDASEALWLDKRPMGLED